MRTIIVVVSLLVWPAYGEGQESLTAARQLYAAAEYDKALTMLEGLLTGSPSPHERQSIALYRTFCLVAVGRTQDANLAIEEMIAHDPLYRPNMQEVPPRLRTAFSEARAKLLPSIIQQKYVGAKAAFDRGDLTAAVEGFTEVLAALSDPDIAGVAEQPPLADLRVLATGFNDLTVRAMAPNPAPQAEAGAAAAAAPASTATSIYTAEQAGVSQPIVVKQDIPPFPGPAPAGRSGVLDIVIDERGAVESATMAESVHPLYDRVLLKSARNWQYFPARIEGAPVKFRKRIQITLTADR